MNPIAQRMFIIVAIVVTVTDLVIYYRLKLNPDLLTLKNAILVIFITLLPIWINFWVHMRAK
ncbi:MAG: hypothetical protein ACK2T5_04715 [Anaerolineales bacterium]